jgi:hypothetical protein
VEVVMIASLVKVIISSLGVGVGIGRSIIVVCVIIIFAIAELLVKIKRF